MTDSISREETAKRNGSADGLTGIEPSSKQFAHWIEKTAYISGYLSGQAEKWKQEDNKS